MTARKLARTCWALAALFIAALLLYSCRDDRPTAPTSRTTPTPRVHAQAAATLGAWTDTFPWPIVAVHAHLLPSGKVLSWGEDGVPYVWAIQPTADPATGTFTAVPSPSWEFCSGHAFYPDGQLLVAGGHRLVNTHGLPDANTFSAATQTWTRRTAMHWGRWYPTVTALPDSGMLAIAGTDTGGRNVPIPEVWKLGKGWRTLSSASLQLPYYPWTFVAPNGRVFYAGEKQQTRYLNTSGTGSWTFVANSNYANGLNRSRTRGSAVMYEPGKVLILGGGNPPTATAEVIDLNQAAPAWRYTNPMTYPRRHLDTTLLADGKVLVIGGTSGSGDDPSSSVLTPEVWDPATEAWTVLAPMLVRRNYHSTALLLPDGRVLAAGSGDTRSDADQLTGQVYSPPYLFSGDGTPAVRPTIASAPSQVGYNQTFSVGSPDWASITRVTLLRLGSVTHSFDENQRFVQLSFTATANGISVVTPSSRNIAPPGYYMLFILNGSSAPSVAKIIQLR